LKSACTGQLVFKFVFSFGMLSLALFSLQSMSIRHTHTHTQIDRDRDRHTAAHHFADRVTPGVKEQVYPEVKEVEKVVHTSTQFSKVSALRHLLYKLTIYRVLSQQKHKKKSCALPVAARAWIRSLSTRFCAHIHTHIHTHTHTHTHTCTRTRTHIHIIHIFPPSLYPYHAHTFFFSLSAPPCPPPPPNTCIIRWG
jgi:hypothetical protein